MASCRKNVLLRSVRVTLPLPTCRCELDGNGGVECAPPSRNRCHWPEFGAGGLDPAESRASTACGWMSQRGLTACELLPRHAAELRNRNCPSSSGHGEGAGKERCYIIRGNLAPAARWHLPPASCTSIRGKSLGRLLSDGPAPSFTSTVTRRPKRHDCSAT